MEIIVGKHAGFCYGVKRAVDGAIRELENNKNTVCCLGELVHNKDVIEDLKKRGINFIEDINEANGATIIRAHGISKETYNVIDKMGIKAIDYTCPNVLKIHEIADEYSKKGWFVFLLGDKKHPEVVGIQSFCGESYFIIENEEAVEEALNNFENSGILKLLIISQTTFSITKQEDIVKIIKNKIKAEVEVLAKNTICNATEIRQKETDELSRKVDYMIVIGGKNSSNTKKLYDISKNNCKNTICIENVNELDLSEVKKFYKIGIMAGASTPQSSINEVKKMLEAHI